MKLPDIIGAISGDALSAAGSEIIKNFLKRRADEAREILFDEIAKGNVLTSEASADDDKIATIFRYLRAAYEGTARLNLRLLAKAIAGRIRAGNLVADEFLLYADALASLSRDEIIAIAAIYNAHMVEQKRPFTRTVAGPGSQPWALAIDDLKAQGWTPARAMAAATRALRSGLLVASAQAGLNQSGHLQFTVSAMLLELAKSVDFDDAIQAEASKPLRA